MELILSVEHTLLLEEFILALAELIPLLAEFILVLAEFILALAEFILLREEFIPLLATDIKMDTVQVTTATAVTSSSNPDFSVDSAAEKTALKTTTKPGKPTMSAVRGKRVARIQLKELKEPKRPKESTDVLLPVMLTPDSSVLSTASLIMIAVASRSAVALCWANPSASYLH